MNASLYISFKLKGQVPEMTAGAFVTLLSVLLFAICVIEAIYRRMKHGKDSASKHD